MVEPPQLRTDVLAQDDIMVQQDKSPGKVPQLNFGFAKQQSTDSQIAEPIKPKSIAMAPPSGLGLNLAALPKKQDYQDEFMANIDNFSESWRAQLRKEKRF